MWKATTGMWKLNFGFQQPSILSGICKYRLYSKAVWISNSSIVPAALNHGLTIILRNLFTETPLKGPVPVGGVAALMNRLGILETRLFLDHYYLVQRSWEGLVKVEMNLGKYVDLLVELSSHSYMGPCMTAMTTKTGASDCNNLVQKQPVGEPEHCAVGIGGAQVLGQFSLLGQNL